jgi:hypothetical protein
MNYLSGSIGLLRTGGRGRSRKASTAPTSVPEQEAALGSRISSAGPGTGSRQEFGESEGATDIGPKHPNSPSAANPHRPRACARLAANLFGTVSPVLSVIDQALLQGGRKRAVRTAVPPFVALEKAAR